MDAYDFIGERVRVKINDKTGVAEESGGMDLVWVDYDNEYGGHYYDIDDLEVID